jgi:hypothetical protein
MELKCTIHLPYLLYSPITPMIFPCSINAIWKIAFVTGLDLMGSLSKYLSEQINE